MRESSRRFFRWWRGWQDYSPAPRAHPSRGPLTRFARCAFSRATAPALESNGRPAGDCSNSSNLHVEENSLPSFFSVVARLAGFEPATPGFVDQCSIQLSYSRSYPVAIGILVRGEHRSFAYFKRSRLLYCSEEAQA